MVIITGSREEVTQRLLHNGVALLTNVHSLMHTGQVLQLPEEARALSFTDQPEYYGSRRVHQQVASAPVLPTMRLGEFANALELAIEVFLGLDCFNPPLCFNDRCVQFYREGSIGIEPHRDSGTFRNLIVLYGLAGSGRFSVYDELGGQPKVQLSIVPGSLLLLMAPGFRGGDSRPIHGVNAIRGPRYVLGMRQKVED